MTLYEALGIIGSYIGLVITIAVVISNDRKKQSKRLEDGRVKMETQDHRISILEKEMEKKANSELVEEKFTNIKEDLTEIKELLRGK